MTDIENRLRDEFRAEAQRAQPYMLRELRLPPRRRVALARPWLAPLAAVIAVITVITGVRLMVGGLPARPAAAAQGVMPGFYVVTQSNGRAALPAVVRRSANGAVVMRVAAPSGEQFQQVTAASDGRTFVLSAVSGSRANRVFRFYRLRLAADGRPGPPTALPLSVRSGNDLYYVSGIALSPGGRELAVAVVGGAFEAPGKQGISGAVMPGRARIEVASLRTGGPGTAAPCRRRGSCARGPRPRGPAFPGSPACPGRTKAVGSPTSPIRSPGCYNPRMPVCGCTSWTRPVPAGN